ncbi:DNA adenine methylase [Sulfobacillus thermosulfidooxidans]|uniref:DNA adenine methylase n=1 Tax=Sulfobacillus thermosulfidooxidans TaxID=28034 RepID=UPI0006B4343F|nr:DNA adenine methylase [Sulfobacillus thermosulfidooxidans]
MTAIPVLWPWQGSKVRLAPVIASRLPPHRTYVEPFAGTAAVLLAKDRSLVEVLNDVNADLVAVYRCLQDAQLSRRLYRRIRWTPVSRIEWNRAQDAPNPDDVVEQAARFLIRMLQGFNGKPDATAWGGKLTPQGVVQRQTRFLHRMMPAAQRLTGVILESGDWRTIVQRYEAPSTCVFCDPPYRTASSDAENAYGGPPWTDADWNDLITWALQTPAMVCLTHYPHPATDRLRAAGWHVESVRLWVNVKGRTQRTGLAGGHLNTSVDTRVEHIWWSPRAWDQAPRQLTWWNADVSLAEVGVDGE